MLLGAANRPLEVISRLYVPMVEMLTVSTASAQEGTSSRAVPAPGVDTVLDARAKAISSRLRCPVCQGESIQDSPAELAAQMKGLVREQIVNGRSDVEVLDYFTQKYGQWILLEPQAQGLNLIVYWIPVLFLVIGGGVLWMVVRKWTRPRTVVDGDLSIDAIDITQK
jgi:cytochrome c-type biogenesis protein CcmH